MSGVSFYEVNSTCLMSGEVQHLQCPCIIPRHFNIFDVWSVIPQCGFNIFAVWGDILRCFFNRLSVWTSILRCTSNIFDVWSVLLRHVCIVYCVGCFRVCFQHCSSNNTNSVHVFIKSSHVVQVFEGCFSKSACLFNGDAPQNRMQPPMSERVH